MTIGPLVITTRAKFKDEIRLTENRWWGLGYKEGFSSYEKAFQDGYEAGEADATEYQKELRKVGK